MGLISPSLRSGPLACYADGFARDLVSRGYTVNGAAQHLRFVAHLNRWMLARGLDAAGLSVSVIEQFLGERRGRGYVRYYSVKAMRPLLGYLTPLGVLPEAGVPKRGPAEDLLERYRQFLVLERGLAGRTADGYAHAVRPFLVGRVGAQGLTGLTAGDVTGFVLAACPHRAVGSAKMIVTALRSLLNWLHVCGLVAVPLSGAVPPVAGWRLSGLPKGLEPDQMRRLLASCDRRRATGRRDYAILLMLARLGLRAGEVAALRLDDIDWRNGEIVVRGKGNRADRLPLPADVGAAIAAYLRRGRPTTAHCCGLFLRALAPREAVTAQAVTMIVLEAGQRAGLGKIHSHRLRHTAATAMVRAGSSLTEVGQVLGHRSLHTTAIYAKVDRDALRALARPWPAMNSGGKS
jgi:site-specific recombinase XerD